MRKFKMIQALLCVLLINQGARAVVNKAGAQSTTSGEEEKQNEIKAEDRISNYGPPTGLGFKRPAPVYGPPELVGDHGPVAIFPPIPPDVPPALGPPPASYGPPRKPIGGPVLSFGVPLSGFPGKPLFGPQKLHLPVKHLGPPVSNIFPPFRLPKPQYGPPLKLAAGIIQHPLGANVHGPVKTGHGPPIPISLESYGPPLPGVAVQFGPGGGADFGQHGDLHGPPPRAPPAGVPAPPTPPDIKYDGWQPIAGLQTQPGHNSGGRYEQPTGEGYSNGGSHHVKPVQEDANVPSDSYGVPIHNQDAQNLKSSVHQSSASSESNGLPPPPLPQFEPLHNEQQNPPKEDPPPKFNPSSPSVQYGPPNGDALSAIKNVQFELVPTSPGLQGGSSSNGGSLDISSFNQLSSSFNDASLSTLQLTGSGGDGHNFQGGGNDVTLSGIAVHAQTGSYNPQLSLGKINSFGVALPPPPPIDSYSAPPLSSYSANGPYPASQAGRAASSFLSSFGIHGSFHKQIPHRHRPHGSFRSPLPPPGALTPPRTREPIKFREPIPPGLLTNLHRYLPPLRSADLNKGPKTFVHGTPLGQQLPTLNAPAPFHQSSSGGGFSTSFSSSSGSFARGNSHGLNSPIAAPHVQYGTPLSFVDFNTPAPVLTYGAPNFGPATSFGATSIGFGNNLYNNLGNGLTTTYGTPVVNGQLSTGGGRDCGFQQTGSQPEFNLGNTGIHSANLELSALPGLPALGGFSSLPALPSSPGLPSLSGLPSLPSHPSPPGPSSLPGHDLPGISNLPGASLPSLPSLSSLTSPSAPASLPSPPSQPVHAVLPLQPDLSIAPPSPPSHLDLSAHSELQQPAGPSGPSIQFDQSGPSGPGLQSSAPAHPGFPDTAPRSQPSIAHVDQNELFKVAVQAVSNTLGGFPVAPSVNHLGLQHIEQQKTDLKDSYGNPIGVTYDTSGTESNNLGNDQDHGGPPSGHGNVLTIQSSGQRENKLSLPVVPLPISAEALTASLTMQGFGQPKIVASNEVDPGQFLKTDEGSAAFSIAQGLAPDGNDGFQIQGSKGTYTLQIQPADGGLGTENSDGSIRHEQVLSNGLLQDILQAIEHPERGPVKLQGVQQPSQDVLHDLPQGHVSSIPVGHFITASSDLHKKDVEKSTGNAALNSDLGHSREAPPKNLGVALFFNSQLGDGRKNTRSVAKGEDSGAKSADSAKSVSKTNTS